MDDNVIFVVKMDETAQLSATRPPNLEVNDPQTVNLAFLQKILATEPTNIEIIAVCLKIIANPSVDVVPELFAALHGVYGSLWAILAKLDLNLDTAENVHMPISVEEEYLLPRVMGFNYLLLTIVVCLKDSAPMEFPPALVRGLLALTRSKVLMTRLLSAGLLVVQPQPQHMAIHRTVVPLVLDLIKRNLSDEILFPLLPLEITPIFMLKALVEQNETVVDTIIDNRYFEKVHNSMLLYFHGREARLPPTALTNIACSLSIISLVCRRRRSCCEYVASPPLADLIQTTLDRHLNMAAAWSHYDGSHSLQDRIGIFSLSQTLTSTCCDMLISLSRSSIILRTFVRDLNLAAVLYSLLSIDTSLLPEQLRLSEHNLKVSVLGVVANTIVEFSVEPGSENMCMAIICYAVHCLTDTSQPTGMKEKCLWVLKNSLFSDNTTFKDQVLEKIPCKLLFQLSEDNDMAIKKQVFDIMRNIIAISNDNADLLISSFNACPLQAKYHTFFNYLGVNIRTFEFLSQPSSSTDTQLREASQKVLETMLYLLVHLSACRTEIQELLLSDEIVDTLHDILSRQPQGSTFEWDLKTAVALVITNLINPTEKAQNNDSNDLKLRKRILMAKSFDSLLNDLSQTTDNIDFQERARLAVFRLSIGPS